MLLVEGGDFVPPETDTLRTELAEFMIEGMVRLAYHAVGLGEEELQLGSEAIRRAAERLPLVCANLTLNGGPPPGIPPVRIVEMGDLRVAVTAYIDPLLFYQWPGAFAQEELGVEDPVLSLETALAGTQADLVVLLAHAGRESIDDVLARVSGVDVTVQGHAPSGSKGVGRIEGSLFVVPGYRSRDVRMATVRFDADQKPVSAGLRVWRLQAFKSYDRELAEMVAAFQAEHGLTDREEEGP